MSKEPDGGGGTITQNKAPVANSQSLGTYMNKSLDITLIGSDPEGSKLTFTIGQGPSQGSLSSPTSKSATTAAVTYTPKADYLGSDSFTFRVNDGKTDSVNATISIQVLRGPTGGPGKG